MLFPNGIESHSVGGVLAELLGFGRGPSWIFFDTSPFVQTLLFEVSWWLRRGRRHICHLFETEILQTCLLENRLVALLYSYMLAGWVEGKNYDYALYSLP